MQPGSLSAWFWATRPWTLLTSGGAALAGMGCAVYDGYFSLPRFVMAILGAMIFQAGTNLINDYYDWKSGVDTFDLLSPEAYGPSLAIQRELLTPDQVWWGGIACFAAGSVLGLILTYLCGWPILLIGVLAILCGYFYTATLIAFASLRHVVKQIRILTRERSAPELNVAMMESGQAHIETCALLTLALLISAALGW